MCIRAQRELVRISVLMYLSSAYRCAYGFPSNLAPFDVSVATDILVASLDGLGETSRRGRRSQQEDRADVSSSEGEDESSSEGEDDSNSEGPRVIIEAGWCENPDAGPLLTKTARNFLTEVLEVWNSEGRHALEGLLKGPIVEDPKRVNDLLYMLTLIQLALSAHSEDNASCFFVLRVDALHAAGHRRLELRATVTDEMQEIDLECLGSLIREVHHGEWLPMVKRLMLPTNYMRQAPGYLQTLKLSYKVPVQTDEEPKTLVFGFNDIAISDEIFDGVQANLKKETEREVVWQGVPYTFNGFAKRSDE
ncbi:hypothetical protein B0H16DRAFT_1765498 [Mycena metata]|uniref:Uncharacterized protein n=1 Tax=Mycena metata TaxID=1033252 RepID=A0AAD7MVM6_9AGAR|nr:hypothetical protein B0H16DRAFT_1765498 [Mycena metata]